MNTQSPIEPGDKVKCIVHFAKPGIDNPMLICYPEFMPVRGVVYLVEDVNFVGPTKEPGLMLAGFPSKKTPNGHLGYWAAAGFQKIVTRTEREKSA